MTTVRRAAPGRARLAGARFRSRARTVEALGLVTAAAAAQKWVPMTWWSRVIGEVQPVPEEWLGAQIAVLPTRAATVTERRVAASVRRASDLLPWDPTCLAQATAGQVMLRQRRQPGVVVIGLRRPERPGRWDAHAWLLGRVGALTGGPAARGFTATTVFVPRGVPEVAARVPIG